MACGGKPKKAEPLRPGDLFNIDLKFDGGVNLLFTRETGTWTDKTTTPPLPELKPIDPKALSEANTSSKLLTSLSGTLIKKTAEENYKRDKEELSKKENQIREEIQKKKKELEDVDNEIKKIDQDSKKDQKKLLISEIRNEIIVNMTMTQNKKYEEVVQEIINRA